MRKKIIAGNWKMHKTIEESISLIKAIHHSASYKENVEVVVSPTFVSLHAVANMLKDSFIHVAAQNVFWEDQGAFTGEIGAPFIKDAGADYVIIGHSERRQYFGETDDTVNKRIRAALKHQLKPMVCIGETLQERKANQIETVIHTQLTEGLKNFNADELSQMVIAYEPVWAIGTGKTATPEQAEEVHVMIREKIAKLFDQAAANKICILYGGSVKASNSQSLLSKPNIDGALIGGASLKADEFVEIIKNA